jgi:hypothetical protein
MRLAFWISLLALVTSSGWQTHSDPVDNLGLTSAQKHVIEDSVRRFVLGVAHDVSQEGPTAWRRHFVDSPPFFMAVNRSAHSRFRGGCDLVVRSASRLEGASGDDERFLHGPCRKSKWPVAIPECSLVGAGSSCKCSLRCQKKVVSYQYSVFSNKRKKPVLSTRHSAKTKSIRSHRHPHQFPGRSIMGRGSATHPLRGGGRRVGHPLLPCIDEKQNHRAQDESWGTRRGLPLLAAFAAMRDPLLLYFSTSLLNRHGCAATYGA